MDKRLKLLKVWKEFGKIISFDSKYRPYVFIFVLLVLFLIPISMLESTPKLSICSKVLGDNCPSAGITRGVSSLLKGQTDQAISYNWLSIPTLMIMITIIMRDLYRKYF